jgi:hypothetical protein
MPMAFGWAIGWQGTMNLSSGMIAVIPLRRLASASWRSMDRLYYYLHNLQ